MDLLTEDEIARLVDKIYQLTVDLKLKWEDVTSTLRWTSEAPIGKESEPFAFRTLITNNGPTITIWSSDRDDAHPIVMSVMINGLRHRIRSPSTWDSVADRMLSLYSIIKQRELGIDAAKQTLFDLLDELDEQAPHSNPPNEELF